MGEIVVALITVVVGGLGGYLLGYRRVRYERLYERRAEVIARLSELLFHMQRGFSTWASPFQSAEVDREEQRKAASDAFQDLVTYYHSNSVWLDLQTCEKIESVMETAWAAAWEYVDELNERGYTHSQAGRDASKKLYRDLPVLRRELEHEFRAILYPPPWYDAPLRLLEWLQNEIRNRRSTGSSGSSE
jgi:hypothetical protein